MLNKSWFTRKGLFYIPVSLFGWIIAGATAALVVYLFSLADSHSHSASDTLIKFGFISWQWV